MAILALALGAAGCGGRHQSAREVQGERLVQLQVREDVACRDSRTVNTDVVPDAPVYLVCRNGDGEDYFAIVSADGRLTSLQGPVRMHPAN